MTMRIPSQITAGDQVTWTELPVANAFTGAVSAPTFSLRFSLRGPAAGGKLDIDGVPEGAGWRLTIPSDKTAAMNQATAAATWVWQAYGLRGAERYTVGSGRLVILPNLAAIDAPFDGRSNEERALDQVEQAIQARLDNDLVTEYTIGGRSLKMESLDALVALRRHYRRLVSRQQKRRAMRNGLGNPGQIGARFTG